MSVQVLTLSETKARCRDAYCAKRLMAQYPIRSERECVYKKGTYGCAIGVSLTEETHKKLVGSECLQSSPISILIAKGILRVPEEERPYLREIQYTHDDWANASRNYGDNGQETIMAEENFLKLIYS